MFLKNSKIIISWIGLEDTPTSIENNLMMAAAANIYSKPGMLPFLSLCSRYPGGPWAGLLQQSIKDHKQNISFGIQRFVNDNDDTTTDDNEAISDSESKSKLSTSAFSPWQDDRRKIEKVNIKLYVQS